MSCGDPITPEWLIGMSAGAVCRVLDDPTGSAIEQIVDAAYEIAYEQGTMSTWTLVSHDADGGSIWASPEDGSLVRVAPDLTIRPHRI